MPARAITSRDEVGFWEGADRHELVVQQCVSCGARRHPPVAMCGECGSLDVAWSACSGRGRVASWMLSQHPNRADDDPVVIVLVELEEGVRVVSNLIAAPGPGPHEGLEVEVDFIEIEDATLPVFRAARP